MFREMKHDGKRIGELKWQLMQMAILINNEIKWDFIVGNAIPSTDKKEA